MKVVYDTETDTMTLILRQEPVSESDEVREGIIIDYNKEGRIVSIEILDASDQVFEPQGILYELRGKERAVAWSLLA
jgi:uncharacterized protein YuzE